MIDLKKKETFMKSRSLRLCLLVLGAWMHNVTVADSCEVTATCATDCSNDCSQSVNTWLPRSFSSYSFHDLFQMQHTHPLDDKDHKLNFTFLTDYMQNFGGKCITGCKNLGSRPFW